MLNGRSKDNNEFTSISVRGLAVVDYCFVATIDLALFKDFALCKILDMLDQFNIDVPNKLSDHSILLWKLIIAFSSNKHRESLSKVCEQAALAFNSALKAIPWDVQRSVCQVSKQASVIFKCTGVCTLTIACRTAR